MKGIDISAWQPSIDWQAVTGAGIQFVIIKLGEACRLDNMFMDHVDNAAAAGLKYGIYYYARAITVEQARQEALWVSNQIESYLNGIAPEMGIWYDMEDSRIENAGADITALCQAFIQQLTVAGYDNAGIYSSYNWLTNGNIDTQKLDVPYWCAQYYKECNFEHPKLKIWQYTDSLKIAGVSFDGNVFFD